MHGWLSYLRKSLKAKERELLSILHLDMASRNSSVTSLRLGSLVTIPLRRSLWHLIRLISRSIFGRRVRNLVGSDAYKDIFPEISLQADSKSASRWGTNKDGEYFAIGVGGALAGRGADLFIIDDPHSEQDAKLGKSKCISPSMGMVPIWTTSKAYAGWSYCCSYVYGRRY